MTVVTNRRRSWYAAELVGLFLGVDVVGDEQVEVVVAIDVEERAARAPHRRVGAAGSGHLRELAVTGVAIEGVRSDVGDVEIDASVVVIVAGARAHSVVAVTYT